MSLSTQSLPSDLSRVPTAAADNNAMQRKAPNKKSKKNPYVNVPPFTLHINQDQQVVIPLDALPLELNKYNGEWARVTQNILPALTGKSYGEYDPNNAKQIKNRIQDGTDVLKQLQKIGLEHLNNAINEKFKLKGKQSSENQQYITVGFEKILKNMVSDFNNDLIGTLKDLYAIVFTTIDCEAWKESAAREFMSDNKLAIMGDSLYLNGEKTKHCFIKIAHAKAASKTYLALANAMDKYFMCSLRKERGGDTGVAGWGTLLVDNVKSTRASSEIHVRLISDEVHHRFLQCASSEEKKLTVHHLVAQLVEAGGKTGKSLDDITSLVKEQWDAKFGHPLLSLGHAVPSIGITDYDAMMFSAGKFENATLAIATQFGLNCHKAEQEEFADNEAARGSEVQQIKDNMARHEQERLARLDLHRMADTQRKEKDAKRKADAGSKVFNDAVARNAAARIPKDTRIAATLEAETQRKEEEEESARDAAARREAETQRKEEEEESARRDAAARRDAETRRKKEQEESARRDAAARRDAENRRKEKEAAALQDKSEADADSNEPQDEDVELTPNEVRINVIRDIVRDADKHSRKAVGVWGFIFYQMFDGKRFTGMVDTTKAPHGSRFVYYLEDGSNDIVSLIDMRKLRALNLNEIKGLSNLVDTDKSSGNTTATKEAVPSLSTANDKVAPSPATVPFVSCPSAGPSSVTAQFLSNVKQPTQSIDTNTSTVDDIDTSTIKVWSCDNAEKSHIMCLNAICNDCHSKKTVTRRGMVPKVNGSSKKRKLADGKSCDKDHSLQITFRQADLSYIVGNHADDVRNRVDNNYLPVRCAACGGKFV